MVCHRATVFCGENTDRVANGLRQGSWFGGDKADRVANGLQHGPGLRGVCAVGRSVPDGLGATSDPGRGPGNPHPPLTETIVANVGFGPWFIMLRRGRSLTG